MLSDQVWDDITSRDDRWIAPRPSLLEVLDDPNSETLSTNWLTQSAAARAVAKVEPLIEYWRFGLMPDIAKSYVGMRCLIDRHRYVYPVSSVNARADHHRCLEMSSVLECTRENIPGNVGRSACTLRQGICNNIPRFSRATRSEGVYSP